MLTLLSIATLVPIILLVTKFEIGYMYFYFFGSILALLLFDIILWKSKRKLHYIVLHTILKLTIVVGVFSIVLINVEVVLSRLW